MKFHVAMGFASSAPLTLSLYVQKLAQKDIGLFTPQSLRQLIEERICHQ